MTISMEQYKINYNAFLEDYKKKLPVFDKFPHSEKIKKVYELAKKYGMLIDEKSGRIYSFEDIKRGHIEYCQPWEGAYKVPKGNWLYKKIGSCGTGCLCVDKGADRPSLNKINSLKYIEVDQVCDGSKEHKPRPRKTPYIAFDYKSKNPINLDKLKSLCSVSKQIAVNDYGKQDIRNLCTGEKETEKETKSSRIREREFYKGMKDPWGKLINKKKKYPSILIFGKKQNNKEFWQQTASVLSDLEVSNSKPTKKLPKKKTKTNKFNLGFEY